jgi:hypothetical protein
VLKDHVSIITTDSLEKIRTLTTLPFNSLLGKRGALL